jgi:hypothetical protein
MKNIEDEDLCPIRDLIRCSQIEIPQAAPHTDEEAAAYYMRLKRLIRDEESYRDQEKNKNKDNAPP